jgi:TetR/AcrR family transcriptional repressor of nem operon
MPRDGSRTRTSLMDAAEALILERGFAGTRVDDVLAATGTTKGAFFHHFGSKQELAHALMERYVELDLQHLDDAIARAEQLGRGPRQRLLLVVGLIRELFVDLTEPYPGCLMASYTGQAGLLDEDTMAMVAANIRTWRRRVRGLLDDVVATSPPRVDVDLDSLADMFVVVTEGAFIVSRMVDEPDVVADELEHYRTYLELLFPETRD